MLRLVSYAFSLLVGFWIIVAFAGCGSARLGGADSTTLSGPAQPRR